MPVYMYGNLNGTYQPPDIDLFALAREQNKQPVRFRDTEAGKNMPAIKVEISLEGLKALHGTELPGSCDVNAMYERLRYESEHQPIESYYHRLSREYGEAMDNFCSENPGRKATVTDKGNILLKCFKSIANEISTGYAEGTRIRFVLDPDSDDGYRRLAKEDELKILQQEFNEFAESRFGKKHQEDVELVMKQMEAVQRISRQRGKSGTEQYQPEKIPDGVLDRLLKRADEYIVLHMSQVAEC